MTARTFARFACIDWSGAAVERPPGIKLAVCDRGDAAPRLLGSTWSRQEVLDWLLDERAANAALIVGIDFSPALPFADRGAYFPGWSATPDDACALWALVEQVCAADPHLAATAFPRDPEIARHYRRVEGRLPIVGDAFEPGLGRLRLVERRCRALGLGPAISSFSLVGAAQVGRSSLTGMRLLHRLGGRVPIWPFDPVPPSGPMIVEIYTTIAARAAGVPRHRSKLRDAASLDEALAALGSRPHDPLPRYDDHSTDALLGAAWLRSAADDAQLWTPEPLTDDLARTEGWTFGVP